MEDDPTYDISVSHVDGRHPVSSAVLVEAIEATLKHFRIPAAAISLAMVDDDRMATLNQRHLGHTGPTDVLSFDLGDAHPGDGDGDDTRQPARPPDRIDGEIVVSIETAAREAQSRAHTVEAEAALYAVHGTLHLVGFDDAEPEQAARMHETEDEILKGLGLGPVFLGGSS